MVDHEPILDEYRRDGVAVIRRLFSARQIREIRAEIDRYQGEDLVGLPADARTLEADGQTVRNLWRLEQYNQFFRELAASQSIVELAEQLVEAEPILLAVETFNKPARVGSGVPWHQDNAYFCQAPPAALTLWVALDPVTPENGPVQFVRGSHRMGMLPTRQSGVRGNSIGVADPPAATESQLFWTTLEPGDATVHHCQTLHRSEGNQTDQSRLALLFVFRGAQTRTDPELQARYSAAVATTAPA